MRTGFKQGTASEGICQETRYSDLCERKGELKW